MPSRPSALQGSPPSSTAARLVWGLALLALFSLALLIRSTLQRGGFGPTFLHGLAAVTWVLALAAFVVSGALIASRQPRNVVGWLLMIPGLTLSSSDLAVGWLLNLDRAPQTVDLSLWLLLGFSNWSWILLIFPVFHLLLTFPDGRLLSRRWRWLVALEAAMVATIVILSWFGGRMSFTVGETTLWSVSNPVGFIGEVEFEGVVGVIWNGGLLLLTVVAVASVALRFRRGSFQQRQQLKWLMLAVALFGMVYGAGVTASGVAPGGLLDVMLALSLAGIPVAVTIAVLRYRLYEIDRIVSRTVAYTLVVGLLATAYVGSVGVLGLVLSAENDLAVAGSVLVVAALANPLRRRVRDLVDRRFNRTRYDYGRVVEGFGESMRHQLDPNEIVNAWVDVVATTLQPASMGIWLDDSTSHPPHGPVLS